MFARKFKTFFKLKALPTFKSWTFSWKRDNNLSYFDCTTTIFMRNSFTNSFQPFSSDVNWKSSLNQFECHPFRNWLKLCSSFNLWTTYKISGACISILALESLLESLKVEIPRFFESLKFIKGINSEKAWKLLKVEGDKEAPQVESDKFKERWWGSLRLCKAVKALMWRHICAPRQTMKIIIHASACTTPIKF